MQDLIMSESLGFGPLSVGGGWVVDELLFRLLVDFEIQKAQRLRYSVSLVCFAAESSRPEDRESTQSVLESVTRCIRGTDAVTAGAEGWLHLLLVDAEVAHLGDFARRRQARHDDHGKRRIGRSDLPQNLDTIERREPDVEHDRVRTLVLQIRKAVFAGVANRGLVAVRAKGLGQNL